jgi:3-mercaptopyruvate sulfurtransferase SseA
MAWRLRDIGFTNTRALLGGFDAWERAGYPIEPKVDRKPGRSPKTGAHKGRKGRGVTGKPTGYPQPRQ